MGEMRPRIVYAKSHTPLVVKASLPRTFLGLGIFVELGFLLLGSYLMAEAILQPLQADTATVVGAGLFLALATVLLFYLIWPSRTRSISRREELEEPLQERVLTVYGKTVGASDGAEWTPEKENLPAAGAAVRQAVAGRAGR